MILDFIRMLRRVPLRSAVQLNLRENGNLRYDAAESRLSRTLPHIARKRQHCVHGDNRGLKLEAADRSAFLFKRACTHVIKNS